MDSVNLDSLNILWHELGANRATYKLVDDKPGIRVNSLLLKLSLRLVFKPSSL